MKSLLFAFLLLAPLAHAQEAPVATAASGNRQLSLILPKGGPALVRDRRSVSLPAGRVALRFPEVPSNDLIDPNSLQLSIDRAVTVLRQESGVTGSIVGLASFVGKQVSLLRPQGSAGEKTVTGTLLSLSPSPLLETAEGILLNPPGVWVLPRESRENVAGNGFRGVQWQVESARAADFPAEATYSTPRLSWNARYTATLAPTRDRLSLRGWLAFQNGTGTNFSGARLSLRDENDVAFEAPRAVTLPEGETQLALLAADVPVSERLIYNAETTTRFSAAINNAHPQRSMTLENSTANGLGVYFPLGELGLWQGEGASLQFGKTAKWGGFRPGDVISVPLGVESSISIDRFIASSKLLNPVTREIVVAWKVTAESGSPTVTIIDNVPARFKLTGATLKPVAVANNQLRFEVALSSTTPVEFRYTVEVPA